MTDKRREIEALVVSTLSECRISFLEAADEVGKGSLARWFLRKAEMCDATLAAYANTPTRD